MVKKIIASTLMLTGGLLLSSCRTYLIPAILGNDMGYMAKPMVSDDKNVAINIAGGLSASSSPGNSPYFTMGILNAYRSHTYKSFNFSYGLFGYLGTAEYENHSTYVETDDLPRAPDFNKSIGGLGLKTSIGYHTTSSNGNTDFRVINWENSISKEMGKYTDYRKEIYGRGLYRETYVSNKMDIWTTGFSTEIIWHARKNKNIQHSFRLFAGITPGLRKSLDRDLSDSYFYTIDETYRNRIAKSFSYCLKVNQFSLIYETSYNSNVATRLSIGYSF